MSKRSATHAGRTPRNPAWKRWEMHQVAETRPTPEPPTAEPAAGEDTADLDHLLEQLQEQARRQGHTEGRKAGHAEGLKSGHAEGYQAGLEQGLQAAKAQAEAERTAQAERLDTLLRSTESALSKLDTELSTSLVNLALQIARQVAATTLAVQPQALGLLVSELLQPQEGQPAWLRVHIHPDDQALLDDYLRKLPALPPWQLIPDDSIDRGGCLLETSLGQIDATLQTRWRNVAATLVPDPQTWSVSP